MSPKLPKNFKFATATAAYQIEGATKEDGRGWSIWDEIRSEKGRIADGSDLQMSCEGRRKYVEDVKLLKEIGVTSYRFSVCWSRILPDGTMRKINEEAIEYYRHLCQLLIENGIEPIITLFHADMPLTIFESGSWLNPENCEHFRNFANLCFEKFGDLCKTWITFNEINMQAWCALVKIDGQPWHCPERPEPENKRQVPYLASAAMLLTHARIFRDYSAKYRSVQNGKIGITNGGRFCFPVDHDPQNIEAAHRAMDCLFNITLEPILGSGNFPETLRNKLPFLPQFTAEEQELIKGSVDFIAINYYLSHLIQNAGKVPKFPSLQEADGDFVYADEKKHGFEKICGETWIRYAPHGLLHLLDYIRLRYGNCPVFISENGCMDLAEPEDRLNDDHRVRYLKGHLEAVEKAIENGCNVIGYTVWSLMDNFEWDDGFAVRFGMCHVDFPDPEKPRTMKKSARFYQEFIRQCKMETQQEEAKKGDKK